jgi:hypothetical protein
MKTQNGTPMRDTSRLTKFSGYSSPQRHIPSPPARPWSDKLMVGSYGPDGRGARVTAGPDGIRTGYRETVDVPPSDHCADAKRGRRR